ncbi:MAG: pyridoxal phosphate-dependent aminotransferase [Hyphomonadaceae bacterium]|nr:pyridoxal phosphate-dependent aminotransferase [Hyphomonadaceae bacterium]MBC6412857.1 pyridoxal phosphate-dependent aminotransferase [Hyphomonadaceae bacterium]
MTLLSEALANMAPSATMAMSQKARDMRAQGINVISLAAGEPNFDTPDNIKNAAIAAIDAGKTGYTAVDGIPELKLAISKSFRRNNRLDYTPSQINVSPGGKAVIYNALAATLDPGDEVVIPTPCWVSYPQMVRLLGGTPVTVPCPANNGYRLKAEDLAAHITDKTRWLVLNSPGNPTGTVYERADYAALADVMTAYPNLMILSDEIYEHLDYSGNFISFAQALPQFHDRTLTMNGVSKAYAMTGWRIGYAGGPEWLVKGMAKVMMQTTSNAGSISQWASVEALDGPQDYLIERRAAFRQRRDFVVERLVALEGLRCETPDGAFYAFIPACEAMKHLGIQSDIQLCDRLLTEAHVSVVPGSAFHGPDAFRLSYAADIEILECAMNRMDAFFSRVARP